MAGDPIKHGPRWRVRWVHPDSKERGSEVLDDLRTAELFRDWLNDHDNRVAKGDPRITYGTWDQRRQRTQHVELTFGEYAQRYLKHRGSDAGTKAAQLKRLETHVKEAWFDLPMTAITRDHLDELIAKLKATPSPHAHQRNYSGNGYLSPNTVYTVLTILSGIFRNARDTDAMKANPFAFDPIQGRPEINLRRVSGLSADSERLRSNHEIVVPPDEFRKMLAAARELGTVPSPGRNARGLDVLAGAAFRPPKPEHADQLYLMLCLMVETGLRAGELLALRCRHVHAAADPPHIEIELNRRRDGSDGRPKADSGRTSVISPTLAARLGQLCQGRHREAALFASPRSGGQGWRKDTWHAYRWMPMLELARAKYGLSEHLLVHPHALRFTHITWSFDAGASARDIMQGVGHRSLVTTQRYDLGKSGPMRAMQKVIAGWTPDDSSTDSSTGAARAT